MSVERPDALHLFEPSSSNHLVLRLHETLISCSKSIETGDLRQSDRPVSELVNFLNSISNSVVLDPDNEDSKNNAFEVLSEIHGFICSSLLDQVVIDALSFELPKAVAKFAGLSDKCLEIVDSVIDQLIEACSPRDMLSIICEALDSPSLMFKFPGYFAPLLRGLSKGRHFEQVKVAVPVILNVLKAASLESDDEDIDSEDLFDRATGIANSIQAVFIKLEGRVNEKLRALLGLFVLQIMALFSISMREKVSSCLPLVLQLSRFLPYCGLSYLGSITGCDVDTITSVVLGDKFSQDGDDYLSYFSHIRHGASLAVIWGHFSNEVAQAAEEDLSVVKDELRSNQAKRWQAVGMLKHIYSSINMPWELKKYAIDFLLCITDGNISQKCNDECMDCSSYIPSLFAALQAVEMVIMYTSDAVLRRNAFNALKRQAENKACQSTSFWSTGVLEFVELVLRPPKGGPPSLPEDSDAVLSALNLYRFVLITESTGKTNYSGVLSKNNLLKAYNEWLLPLQTLVTGIMAENNQDYDQFAVDSVCALNPVELVLYRCIEFVEEKLKHST